MNNSVVPKPGEIVTNGDVKIERITLAARLARIGEQIGYVQKGGTNDAQHYNYVQESDVVAKLRPALAEAGIMVVPEHELISILPFTTAKGSAQFLTTIKSTFTFTDGKESLAVVTVGQGTDAGDKGIYKAMTGAKKYALLQAFLLATGDDPEQAREDEKPIKAEKISSGGVSANRVAKKAEVTTERKAEDWHTTKLSETTKKRIFALGDEIGLDKKALGDVRLQQTGKHSSAQMTEADGQKLVKFLTDSAETLKRAVAASGGELVK